MNDTDQQAPPPPPPPPPPPSSSGPPPGWHDAGHWRSEHLSDYRALRRSHDDKKIAGVAGGVARHLDVDPTIVRVLFVVAIFFGGAGLLVYAVLWLVVPDDTTGRSALSVRDATRNVIVISVLVLAAILALGDTVDGGSISWPPLVVIAVITLVWLMARDRREERRPDAPSGPPPVPPGVAGVAASGTPGAPGTPGGPPPGWSGPTYTPAPIPPRRVSRRRGPLLFGITLALGALALGVLGLLEVSGVTVVDGAYPALALTVVGLMLVVGSVYGRPGGLILLGVVSCVVLAAVSVAQPRFDGERNLEVTPTSADQLESAYDVPAGRIAVDLTDVDDLDSLDGRALDLSANAGELLVVVPEGLTVDLDADVAYGGAVDWPDGTRGGWDFGVDRRFGDAGDPTISIDADLDFGHIELRQS